MASFGEKIRSFAKRFTNLTPHQQQEFERALADIDNSLALTSLETSLDNLRRRPNQFLPIPQPSVTSSVRGGLVEWDAVADQFINFYEIDISSSSNFDSFTTVTTFGTSTVIDGIAETKFVRVRGVRRDGTTTPYSDVLTLSPELFDISVHSEEDFYIPIVGADANVILGGDGSDLDYTPINPDGNSMVWGFVSIYANPAIGILGTDSINVRVKYQYIDIDDSTPVGSAVTVWENTVGEFWSSTAIGPFTIPHPDLNQSIEISLEVEDDFSGYSPDDGGEHTEVFWCHLQAMELGIS